MALCSKRENTVLLSLPGKENRCRFFHRCVIFNNFQVDNHFFGFDFKGYKPVSNEAFPRVASALGHITEKEDLFNLCSGYFIDCLFVVSTFNFLT